MLCEPMVSGTYGYQVSPFPGPRLRRRPLLLRSFILGYGRVSCVVWATRRSRVLVCFSLSLCTVVVWMSPGAHPWGRALASPGCERQRTPSGANAVSTIGAER